MDAQLNLFSAELAENFKKLSYQEKQTQLLSLFYKKLTNDRIAKIVCQGDSMTYGQDIVSADKRAADTRPTDNGTAHVQERAGKTYPEALQENLQSIYGSQVTVINKGYSGDWVDRSYSNWNKNPNADLAFMMLGTNDSNLGATWVPTNVRGNIERYVSDMRKSIERYLDWGTPVILLTPPKLREQEAFTSTNSHIAEAYRNALIQLGLEYNIPVIDTETFLTGANHTYYSDSVHLNTKGYTVFASRLTSSLVGMWHSIPKVKSGDTIGVRPSRDNYIRSNSGVSMSSSANSGGTEEGTAGLGVFVSMSADGWIHYSLKTDEENLILIPIFSTAGDGKLKVELDYGVEQGSHNLLSAVNKPTPQGIKPLSVIETADSSNGAMAWDGTININTTNRYLMITNKGLHNIRVTNTGLSGSVYFNGFVAVSYKDFIKFGGNSAPPETNTQLKLFHRILTHSNFNGTTSVQTSVVNIVDVLSSFGITIDPSQYWRNPPIKIVVYNNSENILEYTLQVGGTVSNTSAWIVSPDVREYKISPNPNAANVRTLASVSMNSSTSELTLNWSGAITRPTEIHIRIA